MYKHRNGIAALVLVAMAASLAACGGGGGGYGASGGTGSTGSNAPTGVTGFTIGFAQPDGTIGVVNDPSFGTVGGYTQNVYSQTVAFAPGTVVTLRNLSAATDHTLNVLSTTSFPASPSLPTTASGGSTLAAGFTSGTIHGGGTLSVTLATAGTYYIGCAYHYMDAVSMRDVIQVSTTATPGPQATPQPSGGGGGLGGGCVGPYC
jgi:plastocyanin